MKVLQYCCIRSKYLKQSKLSSVDTFQSIDASSYKYNHLIESCVCLMLSSCIIFFDCMRIQRRNIKKVWGEGYVTCVPTDDQDLWHIYNLIQKGDHIRMKTSRKIIDETNVSGLKKIRKRILTLTLQIVEINYFAKEDRLCISIKGRNSKENEFLKIGQFHTFEIELETKITIYKEEWPLYEINLIKQIAKEEHGVEIAAMVMEEGVAHLCYVKQSITLLKKKIQRNISKKNAGDEIYRKSLNKFFQECYNIISTLNFQRIKCFVIASPGFLNDQLLRFIKTELQKENDKGKSKWLDKIVLAKCSNGYLNSLNEVLSDPTVMQKMENTKAISQSKTLQEFYEVMKVNQNKVAYGEKEVTRCIKMKAVQKLLISDYLFRNNDFDKRRNINKLYEEVKNYNGQVVIFSSLHPSGEKLKNITGIAAILRFDVLPLEEEEELPFEQAPEKKEAEIENELLPAFDLKKLSLDEEEQQYEVEEDD